MDQETLDYLIHEAVTYPLPKRIAAKFVLDGGTELEFANMTHDLGNSPMRTAVWNEVRDFIRDPKQISPGLKRLANRLT